jgi:hypothetical protein
VVAPSETDADDEADTYDAFVAVTVYVPGRSRSVYVPSLSVVAWRPPGAAVTRAPAMGRPLLESVTVPLTRPVGTRVIRIAWFASRLGSKKPIWRASVPSAFSIPTVAKRPSPGFALFGPYSRSIVLSRQRAASLEAEQGRRRRT